MVDPKVIQCPKCNNNVPPMKFCIKCGHHLPTQIKDANIITKEMGEDVQCPLCRKKVPSKHNFCHVCGGKLKKETAKIDNLICPKCWKTNPSMIKFCIHCGSSLSKWQSRFLREDFQGFSLDINEILKPQTLPMGSLRFGFSLSKDFPAQSEIIYSNQFSARNIDKNSPSKVRLFLSSFFVASNIGTYLLTFLSIWFLFSLWLYQNTSEFSESALVNILTFSLPGTIFLSLILQLPIIFPISYLYTSKRVKLSYQINYNRLMILLMINATWMFFGFSVPLFLFKVGELKIDQKKFERKEFIRSVSWGMTSSFVLTLILAFSCIPLLGIPGFLGGILFDNTIKIPLIVTYISSIWICLLTLLPLFKDYQDKIYMEWNRILYFVFIVVFIPFFFHAYQVISLINQGFI